MSKTTDIIDQLLEYTISPEKKEHYGCTMSIKNIQKNHTIVCVDSDCTEFKNVDELKPGDKIYIEDDDGDLDEVVVNER